METKVLEVRDSGTYIAVLAMRLIADDTVQRYYLEREGFTEGAGIVVMRIADQQAHADPYDWPSGARTMGIAHIYITAHFDKLKDGDVVDVQFIVGETQTKKLSERITYP